MAAPSLRVMDISLGRVLEAARERRATLTPEVAGYVILLAAQQLAAERSRISARGLFLDATGELHVERAGAASELEIETVLRALLGDLIAVCSSPPPAILAVAEADASADLRALVGELTAALIPINHSAARRALARLYREARRAEERAPSPAPPIATATPSEGAEAALPREAPAEPAELDIDVVVEAELAGLAPELSPAAEATPSPQAWPSVPLPSAPEALARDLLAPELPTPEPRSWRGEADEPVLSHVDADIADGRDAAPLLELPPARPRWTETRSDVQRLLAEFLVETRSVEPMLAVLREMIGLDVRAHGGAPSESEPVPAVPP